MQPMEVGPAPQEEEDKEEYAERMGPGTIGKENLAAFIRKVYSILTAQMVLTVVMCMVAMFVPVARDAFISVITNGFLRLLLFFSMCGILCALSSKKSEFPANYYLLIAFTVLMATNVAGICALYQEDKRGYLIMDAFMITMGAFGGLTVYALKSGQDFTWMGGMLSMALFGLIFFGFVGAIFGFNRGLILPFFGTVVFCGFILYDTSRILRTCGPDDAIIAAIDLYLDIINLFLYVLEFISPRND